MKVRHGKEVSRGGRPAPVAPINLGFKPEEEEDPSITFSVVYSAQFISDSASCLIHVVCL